jgi:hypothetical protein
MVVLIFDLVLGKPHNDNELYSCLANYKNFLGIQKSSVKTFFLHQSVRESKHAIYIELMFNVNHASKTLTLPTVNTLYKLAHSFKFGSPPDIRMNLDYYVICLALICRQLQRATGLLDIDLRQLYLAISELENYYTPKKSIYSSITKLSLSQILFLKKISLSDYLKPTMVQHDQIQLCEQTKETLKRVVRGTHSIDFVRINHGLNLQPVSDYVLKKNVKPRIANFEVFSATMMELYIGPHQPSTFQVFDESLEKICILSQKIEFETLRTNALTQWSQTNFQGSATIDVACLYLGENDYHVSNAGLRFDNGKAIRIDFDRTFSPVTQQHHDKKISIKEQRRGIVAYPLPSLTKREGFNIHFQDLISLPTLYTPTNTPEDKKHFVPYNWWAHDPNVTNELQKKISKISLNEHHLQALFIAILEKIIMPTELVIYLAHACIFHLGDKRDAIECMLERQQQIRIEALKIPGFIDFLAQAGLQSHQQIIESFSQFLVKRSDLAASLSKSFIVTKYKDNFKELLTSLKITANIDCKSLNWKQIYFTKTTELNYYLNNSIQISEPSNQSFVDHRVNNQVVSYLNHSSNLNLFSLAKSELSQPNNRLTPLESTDDELEKNNICGYVYLSDNNQNYPSL